LIKRCTELNVPIISSMGTGNKLDPTHLQITDIYKTKIDPLAKVMRRELKARRIKKCLVAYSDEIPAKTGQRTPGSSVFVPASAGLMIAGYVFQSLIGG
jgi:tRNA A37 threonylcarbamoyladenosine dehydratase